MLKSLFLLILLPLITLLINDTHIWESLECPVTLFSPCNYMTDGCCGWSGSENLREWVIQPGL